MRNFLDLMHLKHESDNPSEYPPGIPSIDAINGRKEEIEEALDILQSRQQKKSNLVIK
jgi:hypothetical protein